jgi:hypothetical protein
MVDILNGKGTTGISTEDLLTKEIGDLVLDSVSEQPILESAIIEAMSNITYNKDQDFITERIRSIQELLLSNKEFLFMLVKQKLNFKAKMDKWYLMVAKNEFLMKSHLTFHDAALFSIRQELVKQMSFIIYYLEQDGIV